MNVMPLNYMVIKLDYMDFLVEMYITI
jgi:hypothetical protein